MAAGFGSRMKEYTKDTAKPMLPVNGKPIIEYTIQQLVKAKIPDIGLNLHFHADQIKNYFLDGKKWGASLNYVYESQPTGTAGGAKSLENFLQAYDDFVLIYGDILTDFNFSELVQFHQSHRKIATVCLHRRTKSNSIVSFDQDQTIQQFIERPSEAELAKQKGEFWVNSAIYCFKKEILNLIPKNNEITDLPRDIFPGLLARQELKAFPINCHRIAIDDEARYKDAQAKIQNFKF